MQINDLDFVSSCDGMLNEDPNGSYVKLKAYNPKTLRWDITIRIPKSHAETLGRDLLRNS
ncbi:MAG: hypothetical protein ACPGGK_12985 [Pikeienuella sp.]